MTDRDHFAAAAFAGLLAQGDDGSFSEESYAVAAYRWADALLRVRDSRTADNTNHDAAPAATATADRYVRRAAADGDSDRTDKAAQRPSEGTGDTPVTNPKPKEKRAEVSDRPKPISGPDPDSRVWDTPCTPPPHATPAKCSVPRGGPLKPVAWAVCCDDIYDSSFCGSFDAKNEAEEWAGEMRREDGRNWDVVPLYRHPPCQDVSQKNLTLTDDEMTALRIVSSVFPSEKCAATLRGLLERLGGVR